MTDSRPKALIFSEARYEAAPAGTLYAESIALAGEGWKRDFPPSLNPVLVARASIGHDPKGEAVVGESISLPYYIGVRQAAVKLLATWRKIDQAIEHADLVVIKVPGLIGAVAAVSAHRHAVPVAAQVVGDAGGVLKSGAAGRVLRAFTPLVELITRSAVHRAQAVRYVTRSRLQQRYPARMCAETHSFSDVEIVDSPLWRGENLSTPRLVAVGSLDQLYKGHHHLLAALVSVRRVFPDAMLTIVGSGRQMDHLRELAVKLGVSSAVDFRGYVSRADDLYQILADATLFVLPSLTEGMPRALIEAMAVGTPSIASRVGGVPELLPASETFDAGDVAALSALVIELHGDPGRLRKLSRQGVEATRIYTNTARAVASADWQAALLRLATRHRKGQL